MTEGVGINQGENPRVEQPPRVFPEVELHTRGQVNPIGRSDPSFTIQMGGICIVKVLSDLL